jgi:hypothetical protein
MDVDVDAAAAERWVRPCANTAPTAAYVALLEDAFGPGSVLRGEGAKPLESLRPRKMLGKGKGRGRSTTTERSTSSEGDMDVDTDANVDVATGRSRRAPGWIAEIQTVVKGKRQLAREVRFCFIFGCSRNSRMITGRPVAPQHLAGDCGHVGGGGAGVGGEVSVLILKLRLTAYFGRTTPRGYGRACGSSRS